MKKLLKRIRIAIFGLNTKERMEIHKELQKELQEVDKRIRAKYAEMEALKNTPVPRCGG